MFTLESRVLIHRFNAPNVMIFSRSIKFAARGLRAVSGFAASF